MIGMLQLLHTFARKDSSGKITRQSSENLIAAGDISYLSPYSPMIRPWKCMEIFGIYLLSGGILCASKSVQMQKRCLEKRY